MKCQILRIITMILLVVGCFSCQSKNEAEQPLLSDEQIFSNLSKNGSSDPALLIGEWDIIKFAYTADGNKITDTKTVTQIEKNNLCPNIIEIRNDDPAQYISNVPSGLSGPWMVAGQYHFYSMSENLIYFSRFSDHLFPISLHITDDGHDVLTALQNTYSFVICNNELIIHFTGVKDRNLLILKKTI